MSGTLLQHSFLLTLLYNVGGLAFLYSERDFICSVLYCILISGMVVVLGSAGSRGIIF